ncbi:hypothetical protein NDU88_004544 [Pleurodeles waltl]|uniref:Uncharacterized protein n=1 Tax=Pleurodeles waltl TaxID=8319 RepID=A0AAV7PDD8_PLEWA|nr:hypothetical protein NDU88_004544 [Pleurodeles waltl]
MVRTAVPARKKPRRGGGAALRQSSGLVPVPHHKRRLASCLLRARSAKRRRRGPALRLRQRRALCTDPHGGNGVWPAESMRRRQRGQAPRFGKVAGWSQSPTDKWRLATCLLRGKSTKRRWRGLALRFWQRRVLDTHPRRAMESGRLPALMLGP